MWAELKSAGLDPMTATNDLPPVVTMGDVLGSVDPLCHELVRRLRADSFFGSFFVTIDYFERFPLLDMRDRPNLKIIPNTRPAAVYGPGDVSDDDGFQLDFWVSENGGNLTPVLEGYPTINTLHARLAAFIHAQSPFNVQVNFETVPLARYNRPGPLRSLNEPTVDKSGILIANTQMPWFFDLENLASSQKNYNVAAAGG